MVLPRLAKALTLSRSDHPVPARLTGGAVVATAGTPLVPTVYDRLNRRRRRRAMVAAWCIAVPTLISIGYYFFVASDRFVSESRIVVSSGSSSTAPVNSLLSMIGIGSAGDGLADHRAMLYDYLLSSEVMSKLQQTIDLRAMWSRSDVDFFSRLRADASREAFHDYYRSRVHVVAEPSQPVIAVSVQAFTAADAQQISRALLQLGEQAVNQAFNHSREDALSFARDELSRAESRLAAADEKVTDFRRQHRELDPAAAAQSVGTVAGNLFGELSNAEAELKTVKSYLSEDSPKIKLLRARIAALKTQIAADRSLLVGAKDTTTYVDLLAKYETLITEQKFAQTAYTSAMAFLATTRADLLRQHSYVVDFVPPSLPEEAVQPQRTRGVILVLIASVLAYLIGNLVVSALREHARL